MAILNIITGKNNPTLREKSTLITQIEPWHLKLISDMTESMQAENGVGLAAPQVGYNVRLLIAFLKASPFKKEIIAFINPEITARSKILTEMEEGCLSLPEEWGPVLRPNWIEISYLTPEGEKKKIKEISMNARILQHEIDHLDGILFIDHVKRKEKRKEKNSILI